MKITRLLPKPLAIAWQEYDINKLETYYEYHQRIARPCWILIEETGDSTYVRPFQRTACRAGTIEFPIHHECGKVDSCVRFWPTVVRRGSTNRID